MCRPSALIGVMEREVITLDFPCRPECGGGGSIISQAPDRAAVADEDSVHHPRPDHVRRRAARAAVVIGARGERIILRRPAPVEPDVPRTFSILYEDDDVIAIDKPAGLPMHTTAKF